jgi:hypothetical protein
MFEEVFGAAKAVIQELSAAKLPVTLPIVYGPTSPLAGKSAGNLVLLRNSEGAIQYSTHANPLNAERVHAPSDLVLLHQIDDVASLARWTALRPDALTFVKVDGMGAHLKTMLHEQKPELGVVATDLLRHPDFSAFAPLDCQAGRDLSHVDFADLLLDRIEALDDPMVAAAVASFRSAKTISYTGDLDTGATVGVSVSWAGKSKSGEIAVPREFSAHFRAFAGLAEVSDGLGGDELASKAVFRVRVMAGKEADAAPVFRVRWANAPEFALDSSRRLLAHLERELKRPVFLGVPKVQHYAPIA